MPRGRRISEDLRWTIIRARDHGHNAVATASLTGVSQRQVRRIQHCYSQTGDPRTFSSQWGVELRGRRSKLTVEHRRFIEGYVTRDRSTYLDELWTELTTRFDLQVSLSTIWRHLNTIGYTYKKINRAAIEQNDEARWQYRCRMRDNYLPEQLVFVDECASNRRIRCDRGRSLCGERAHKKVVFLRGRRFSVLPALSLDGILNVKIIEGSFNTESFKDFIDGLLDHMNPFPGRNSVIIMDNCRIHRSQAIKDMIEERGMRWEFLSSYSPDFNPIELAFSKFKSYIRRRQTRLISINCDDDDDERQECIMFLHEGIWSITVTDAEGYFRHCNYT